MTTPALPTRTQFYVLKHFDSDSPPRWPLAVRATPATFAACVREGWIIKAESYPYYRTTDAGRAAVEACAVPCTALGCKAVLPHRFLMSVFGWRMKRWDGQYFARCPKHLIWGIC